MTHTLTAKEQSLAKIFSDDYVFSIPGYQRPYSWGTEQADELMGDLLAALATAPSQLADAPPYFLGSIVLIKAEAVPHATVVDGQQRLTTLTLLLSAIRAAVQSDELQKDITGCIYERGSLVKGTEARYRLSLRERDREFFRVHVQHEDGLPKLLNINTALPDAQSRMQANARLFAERLSVLTQDELVRLVQFVITRCYLVTVATPDLDSAYRIFGVLNSRGLDLSATDILKAEIVGGIERSHRDHYTQKWEDEEEGLGRESFGELFSHMRMVYSKSKPRGTLLKEFKEHVKPLDAPAKFIDDLLLPMSAAYREISEAAYASVTHAEVVNSRLQWINRIEFKDWVPPALAFVVRHRNEPQAMADFFGELERLTYSMLVRKAGVNERMERFARLTSAVEHEQALLDPESPLQLTAKEQFEVYQALDGPLYATHSPRALAVLLLRLDALVGDASASYQHETVTVEHVLPQQAAPASEWVSWIPDAGARAHWVHRLGNLALLSRKKNSAASNYDFDTKKAAYFTRNGTCPFPLTTQVLSDAMWTVDVLEQRQQHLLGRLEAHWRLQDREDPAQSATAWMSKLPQAGDDLVFEIQGARHGLSAKARETGQTFRVLAGSMARQEWIGKESGYQQLRADLVAAGKIVASGDGPWMVFADDVDFSSPSAASAVVLGRPDNGRTSWRLLGTTITYAAWQEQLPVSEQLSGEAEA